MAISATAHWFDPDRSNVMSAGSMPHQPEFEGHSSSYGMHGGHPGASHYGQHSELSDPRMARVMDSSSSSSTGSPYAASAHPHGMTDPNSPMAGSATFPFLSSHGGAPPGHGSTGSPSMTSSSSYRHSITSLPATIDSNYYHQRQSSMGSVSSVQDMNGDHAKYGHPGGQHAAFGGARNWPWAGPPAAPSSATASRQGSLSSQGGHDYSASTAHSRTPSYVYAYPSSVASTASTATSARGALPPNIDPSVPLSHHIPEAYPMSQRPQSTGTGTTRRAKFKRSRTGCLVCRKRKVKCSQDGQPCKQCRIGKRDCHYEENPPKRKRRTKAEQEAEAARQRDAERATEINSRVPTGAANLASLHMPNGGGSGGSVPSSNGVGASSQQWRGNGQAWMPEGDYGGHNGHSGSGWYGGDSHSANAYSYDRGHGGGAGSGSYGGLGVVADAALNAQPMPSRGGYHRDGAGYN